MAITPFPMLARIIFERGFSGTTGQQPSIPPKFQAPDRRRKERRNTQSATPTVRIAGEGNGPTAAGCFAMTPERN